jgi:hypothetical protein
LGRHAVRWATRKAWRHVCSFSNHHSDKYLNWINSSCWHFLWLVGSCRVKGVRFFECPQGHGAIVRPEKVKVLFLAGHFFVVQCLVPGILYVYLCCLKWPFQICCAGNNM